MEDVYKTIKDECQLQDKAVLSAVAYYHNEMSDNNKKMNKEIEQVEAKFHELYAPIYEKMDNII